MWPIKTCLFFTGFVAACALSLAYPIVGVSNYMLIYMINPDKMWWGKPLEPLGIRYSLTAAVCLILGMIISSSKIPRMRPFIGTWEMLAILFALLVVASMIVGTGVSDSSVVLVDKVLKMTVFLLCLTTMASIMGNYRIVLWTLVIGCLVLGHDAYYAPSDDFADGRLNFVGGPDFRESSGLAAHMSAILPLIGAAFLVARSWRWRVVALLAGVLTVNTIIQCRTRSAFIGLAAAALVAVVLIPRTRRWRLYLLLVAGGVGAYALTDGFFWHRMSTVFEPDRYGSDTTIVGRIQLWQVAWQMFGDHPFGVGVGQFKHMIAQYETSELSHAFAMPRRVTHNSYLLCLTELGVQGFLGFMALVAVSMHKSLRCFKLAHRTDNPLTTRILAFGSVLSLVTYLVTAFFTDRLYTESFWWVLALPVCMEGAVTSEVHRRAEMVEPDLTSTPVRLPGFADEDSPRCALS